MDLQVGSIQTMNIPYKEVQQPMFAHPVDKFIAPATSSRQQSRYHRTINLLTVFVLLGFSILFVSDWLGIRLNTTRSVAPGFYWVINKLPEKADFISFCPAHDSIIQMAYARGYISFGNCPGHYERLLKIVVGVSGDKVEQHKQGVYINGTLLPQSAVLSKDGLGRPLLPFSKKAIVLKPDELWVMTNQKPLSFDSRYFGAIRLAQISDVVRLLWTWR
jgi:conjugative transfer signal peptidase TraF